MNRRLFLGLAAAPFFAGGPAMAELLSRGKYGGRQAYFDRVLGLSSELAAVADGSERMRDIAVTLAAALQDFAFNEAGERDGKALPPLGGLQRIEPGEAPVPASTGAPGPPRDLEDVPMLWFVDRVNQARDRTAELVTLIDSGAALPHDYKTAIADIVALIRSIDRPPE